MSGPEFGTPGNRPPLTTAEAILIGILGLGLMGLFGYLVTLFFG